MELKIKVNLTLILSWMINFISKVKEKYYQIIFTLVIQEISLLIFVIYQATHKVECEVIFYLNLFDLIFKTLNIFIFTIFLLKKYIISKFISITFLALFVISNEIYLPILFINISQGMGEGICPEYLFIVLFFIIWGLVINIIYSCIFGSLNYHLIRFREISDSFSPLYFLDKKEERNDDKECVICFINFNDDEKESVILRCNHTFHKKCILEWFTRHKTCPICRREY